MLDKQYSRVIRWIRRAQSMSADGNFSDAILDGECARAELDDARQELLLCHQGGNARRSVRTSVMILPAALAAVFCRKCRGRRRAAGGEIFQRRS